MLTQTAPKNQGGFGNCGDVTCNGSLGADLKSRGGTEANPYPILDSFSSERLVATRAELRSGEEAATNHTSRPRHALSRSSQGEHEMSVEENKAIVRRLIEEVFNEGDLDAIGELISPDFVGIGSGGPEGFKRVTNLWLNAFPDLHATIDDMIAEGDKVAVRTAGRATHKGEFSSPIFGSIPATGKEVVITETVFLRIVGDKIVEWRSHWNQLDLFQQLGVVPLSARNQE